MKIFDFLTVLTLHNATPRTGQRSSVRVAGQKTTFIFFLANKMSQTFLVEVSRYITIVTNKQKFVLESRMNFSTQFKVHEQRIFCREQFFYT